ncbi:MAG: BamA/TamA family outer membrane protein [Acidobacteria bacterium]|nr:BamA/TamA family outer membrane protein [Acidobacteriota bacterium]
MNSGKRFRCVLPVFAVLMLGMSLPAQTVKKVEMPDNSELLPLVSELSGKELDAFEVSRSIHDLYKTGLFSDIRVEKKENADASVTLRFLMMPQPYFQKPQVEGEIGVKKKKLRTFMREYYPKDRRYTEEGFQRFLNQMRGFYKRVGFPDAIIKGVVRFSDDGEQAFPVIDVRCGAPVMISRFEFIGRKRYRKIIHLKSGERFNADQLKHDIGRLRRFLKERRFYDAVVRSNVTQSAAGRVKVSVTVKEGPAYKFVVKNAKLDPVEFQDVFQYVLESGLSPSALRVTENNLYFKLLEKGFCHPEVTYRIEGKQVIFTVKNAVRLPVSKVEIQAEEPLKVSTPAYYNRIELSRVETELSMALKKKGFLHPRFSFDYLEKTKTFRVTVKEGKKIRFGKVSVKGANGVFKGAPGIEKGKPFSTDKLRAAVLKMEQALREKGYYNPVVSIQRGKLQGNSVAVTFMVQTGGKRRVSAIYYHGNRKIRKPMINRIIGIRVGDLINVDEIRNLQNRLESSGFFSNVDVMPYEIGSDKLALFIRLKEQRLKTIRYGVGVNSDEGIRFSTTLVWNYLFHRRLTGTLLFRVSPKRQQVYFNISGRQHFMSSVFFAREDKSNYLFSRWGASISYNTTFGRFTNTIFSLEARRNHLANVSVPYDEIEKELQPNYTLSLNSQLLYDRRNNLLYPTKGYYLSLKLEPAMDLSKGQFFMKMLEKTAFFAHRFSFSQTVGQISAPSPENYSVPLPERFFSGGVNSLRISSFEQAGPLFSTGNPMGGRFLALFNAEYTFPLGSGLNGVVFTDVGNVWSEASDASWQSAIKDAGLGVHFKTPLGPVRVEVAWNLDRDAFPSRWKLLFSIGRAF